MSRRAARICGAPGCGAITQGSRCGAHEVTQSQRRGKDPEQQRFYSGGRWTKISKLVRKQEPICRMCRIRPSTTTDHINGRWEDCARENLQALCKDCHLEKSGKEHRRKQGGV